MSFFFQHQPSDHAPNMMQIVSKTSQVSGVRFLLFRPLFRVVCKSFHFIMGNTRICAGKGGFFTSPSIYDPGVEVVEVSLNYNGTPTSAPWAGFRGILSRNAYDVCISFSLCQANLMQQNVIVLILVKKWDTLQRCITLSSRMLEQQICSSPMETEAHWST